MKYCQSCGKRASDNDVACLDADCRGHLESHPPVPTPTAAYDIDVITKQVWKRLWKKHILIIFGEFSIVMLIGLYGLIQIYQEATAKVQQLMVAKIDAEFKTETIRATISNVAAEKAGNILEQEVHPAVTKLTNDIIVFSRKIDDLTKTKEQQEAQIAALNKNLGVSTMIESNLQDTMVDARSTLNELDKQSQFVTTSILADHDDREAYERLVHWGEDPSSKYGDAARKISVRIQAEYFTYTGPWVSVPWDVIPDGTNHASWSMPAIFTCWKSLPSVWAKNFVDFVIGATNITQEERISFLRQVYLTDSRNSLYAEQTAAYHIAGMLKAAYNPSFVFSDIENKWAEFRSTNHLFATETNLPTNTIYDIIIPSVATNRVSALRNWGETQYLLFKLNHPFVPNTLKGKLNDCLTGVTYDIDISPGSSKNIVTAYFTGLNFSAAKLEFRYQKNVLATNVEEITITTNSIILDHSSQITIPSP